MSNVSNINSRMHDARTFFSFLYMCLLNSKPWVSTMFLIWALFKKKERGTWLPFKLPRVILLKIKFQIIKKFEVQRSGQKQTNSWAAIEAE